jgi:thiamine-phosphate pyrophosphorylase
MEELARIARRLNRQGKAGDIPSLFCFTDPARMPDPCAVAARLPKGSAVVYRHFGAGDRLETAMRLKRICASRGVFLLIGADPKLARAVKAEGVHWPEKALPARRMGFQLETGAAHSAAALHRIAKAGLDAAMLSPVFPSRSASAGKPLGPFQAGRLARGARMPVVALGGVHAGTAKQLAGLGFSGLAAVDALRI